MKRIPNDRGFIKDLIWPPFAKPGFEDIKIRLNELDGMYGI